MVTISGFKPIQSAHGTSYNALILEGGFETIKSTKSEAFFLRPLKAYLPSTLDKQQCFDLIGKSLPGKIVKSSRCSVKCELNKSNMEIIHNHEYIYLPESTNSNLPKSLVKKVSSSLKQLFHN